MHSLAEKEYSFVSSKETVSLPEPRLESNYSVERALASRRSVRDFSSHALELAELGQLLWSVQGITSAEKLRTAPSAGALYPLEIYVAAGSVAGLVPGIYHYLPQSHTLALLFQGDRRMLLAHAALEQKWLAQAPATFVFTAVPSRTTRKYGKRGMVYIEIEVGHAAQNMFLQAQAIGMATAAVGAFEDESVAEVLGLSKDVQPLYLMPVGRPA